MATAVGMEWPHLRGAGAMAAVFSRCNWEASPVGPPKSWSPALKSALGMILPAKAEIALFWGENHVAFYNEAYAPTIGLKHPKALGRPASENWAELWADLEPLLRGVRETGETFAAKDRAFYIERHGVGETVYFDISFSAVWETDGEIGGVLCVVSETTSRVRAQEALASQRERLARLFAQAPGFMALLEGPTHIFTLVNPAYQQVVGERVILGRPVAEALPEVASQGLIGLLDRVYTTGEPYRAYALPLQLQGDNGSPARNLFLDFVYQPIKSETGGVTGIFVEGTDVTESVRAAEELRESEARFRSFAQAMPHHFWTATPDGLARLVQRSGDPLQRVRLRRTARRGLGENRSSRRSARSRRTLGASVGRGRGLRVRISAQAPQRRLSLAHRARGGRSAIRRGRSTDGSAPTPTSRTRKTSPRRSPTSMRRWRPESPSARSRSSKSRPLCASRRRWRRSASLPAASRTISTTCCRRSPAPSTGCASAFRSSAMTTSSGF